VSATILQGLVRMNHNENCHDCLSNGDIKLMRAEENILNEAMNSEIPLPKIYADETASLIANGLDEIFISANFKTLKTMQRSIYIKPVIPKKP
jgi:hypothetical protein